MREIGIPISRIRLLYLSTWLGISDDFAVVLLGMLRVKLFTGYGCDLDFVAEHVEREVNSFLQQVANHGCEVRDIDVRLQMDDERFAVIAMVVYTCSE